MTDPLSYGRQWVSDGDVEAVVQALRSDWLTQGPLVKTFEDKLAESVGAKHAIACSSGTAALHLAVMAAGLDTGQTAVVPAVTFVATANAVRMTGAEVIFADVDQVTGRMTGETLAAALDAASEAATVTAVLPVHLAGASSSMPEIAEIADEAGAAVIEDACHALGGNYERKGEKVRVGECADSTMACFSFHPVKPVTTGEGGAVTTNDAALVGRMRSLRSHGVTRNADDFENREQALGADGEPNPWYYEMPEIGWNYRLSDIQCALGVSQLDHLEGFRARRHELANAYRQLLAPLAPAVRVPPDADGVVSGHHLFRVLIDFAAIGKSRGEIMKALKEKGIGTQVHYIPVPWQPYYASRYGAGDYPGAAAYYGQCLSLPLFVGMSEADVERVVHALTSSIGAHA